MQGFGDNFTLVIVEEDKLHTDEYPFCPNDRCPCREDQEAISTLNAFVLDGLITPDEATAFMQGRTI